MKIENLKVNMIVKNYKEMCNLLGQKVRTNTKDKTPQLKKWERYFKYHKEGNKFIIDEIYIDSLPEPFQTDDVYSEYLQKILCNYLMQSNDYKNICSCSVTKRQLFEICGMVNNKYNNNQYKSVLINKFTEDNNLSYDSTKWQMNQFSQRVNSRLTTILYRSLSRLQKKGYIIFFDYYTISEKAIDSKLNVERDALADEISLYIAESNQLKDELNITYLNDYNSTKFYSELNNRLFDKFAWNSCYKKIKIIIAQGYMDKAYNDSLSQSKEEIEENKRAVNNNILEMFNKVIVSEFEKNRQEVENIRNEMSKSIWGEMTSEWIEDKIIHQKYPKQKILHEQYIQLQKQLLDLFIKI